MLMFLAGAAMLAAIIGLFWLKDRLQSPTLSRIAYSNPIARLAVIAAALMAIGLLVMVGGLFGAG